MTEPLSPAAAIVKAFDDRYELLGGFDDNWQELCIAAALRAAADHVGDWDSAEDLRAFATELEALND